MLVSFTRTIHRDFVLTDGLRRNDSDDDSEALPSMCTGDRHSDVPLPDVQFERDIDGEHIIH